MVETDPHSPYPPTTWRFLDTGWQDGATNMAIDEAIMEAVRAGTSRPTLRFYGWDPACLSLGHAQPATVVAWDACAAAGWDVVRRPTGGRAILHVDELTYSVCAPESEARLRGGVLESYLRLSDALAHGLTLLGLAPERAPGPAHARAEQGPVCFDDPSHYEIVISGRKLIGSAQARKRGTVLQHGTLPLYGDITRILHALAGAGRQADGAVALRRVATTLEESAGRRITYAEAVAALRQGFAEALNLTFVEGTLTAAETARAQEIRSEKYTADRWTSRI